MNDFEKNLLSKILSDRLLDNWDKCDKLPMGSEEYDRLTDECGHIRVFIRKWQIPIDQNVSARF